MAGNKTLIWIIAVMAVVIIALVGYYALGWRINAGSGPSAASTSVKLSGDITQANFVSFPAGTQIKQGIQGTVTNTFKKDNMMGVEGASNLTDEELLTFKVFDSSETRVPNLIWRGNDIKIKVGTFGFCCFNPPQEAGKYNFKIYLNGQESRTLPFEVI